MIPLVLVGAGGFGREAASVVAAINDDRSTYDLLGFVDDSPDLAGHEVGGIPVLGGLAILDKLATQVVVCTGHPGNYTSRRSLVERIGFAPERYATLIHPAAVIPHSTQVGPGTVILATAVATTTVTIGCHVTIMPAVVLTHDDVVGDYAIFGAGAKLAGGVEIGVGVYIGSGALVREARSVGDWSLVGMGAVVTRDIPPGEVWAGVPARRLRSAAMPADPLKSYGDPS